LSQVNVCLSCQHGISLECLLPHLAGVVVESAGLAGSLCLQARARADHGVCPRCGQRSGRVHSTYGRRLADTAIGGQPVVIRLRVRRFFCGNPGCAAVTFAEQVSGLTCPRARRTPPLARMLTAVALALAGRAGARLAAALGLAASRSGLLRLVMALPVPEPGTVKILGCDDFAFRRGRDYGTVLIDMETGRPVDLLGDREADTLEKWLLAHPGTEVICRDRAGAYADGARKGAPDAAQVADRWHLYHNLAQHVAKEVARHRGCLDEPAPPPPAPALASLHAAAAAAAAARTAASPRAARARQRYQQVQQLRAQGHGLPAITAATGLPASTAWRYWHAASLEDLLATAAGRRPAALDPYADYLTRRWAQGARNARALHQEITARGYTGSYRRVRDYLHPLRALTPAPPPRPAPPKTREITTCLLRHPGTLTSQDKLTLQQVTARCPHLAALAGHITAFAEMLTGRHGDRLDAWITAAAASDLPSLHSFTAGLKRDHDAVRNGLTLPWSSGPVEGHVTRIKLLKRQAYGHASFALLRRRVLLPT
jgi:transposase